MELQSLQAIAVRRASWGDFKTALGYFYAVREKLIEIYGNDHRVTAFNQIEIQIAALLYLQGEFEEALKLYTKTLEKMEKYPEEYIHEIFETKCHIAALYSRKMKKDLAARTYEELREHIRNSPGESLKTIDLKKNLALSLKQAGELHSALEIFIEIYESMMVTQGEKAHTTEYSHADVGIVLLEQGKYRESLSILEKVHNSFDLENFDEISYLRMKRYLADAHMYLGLVKIAEDLYKSLMEDHKKLHPFHPEVLVAMHNWGRSLDKMKKPEKALQVLKEVYSIRCEQSPKHPDTAKVALDIATIYLKQNEYINALIHFVDVPAQISSTIKWNPDLLLHSVTSISSIFDASEDVKEQLFEVYQHVFKKQYEMRGSSDHHKDVLQSRTRVGELLISLQRPNEALEVLKDVLEKRTLVLKNDYIDCIDVMKGIANAYFVLKQYVEAFEYYSEVYEIQKLITGDNSMEAVNWESKIMEITNLKEKTVLIDAVVSNYRISIKATTDYENNVSMEDNFPLHVAAETGRIAMVKFLLFKGAIYNEENSEGKTPVNIACNNTVKSFFNLIDKLFFALKKVDSESLDQILDIMNDTSLREDVVKGFPMLLTGLDRIRDIIDKTILNARDETGSTPLHLACSNGDVKTIKRLLALEVDQTLTDKSNKSPRDVAVEKKFDEILQLLDSNFARQNKDLDDCTISQKNPEMPEDIMDQ